MYSYITKELSEKTSDKRTKNAYERNYITITVIDNKVFYLTTDGPINGNLYNKIISETLLYFPALSYLFYTEVINEKIH